MNAKNQITNSGFSYDLAGDLTGDGSYSYAYDAEGRITSTGGVNYAYDGDGLRVQKSNGTIYWRSITGDTLSESDLNGNVQNEYVFFGGRITARRDSLANVYFFFADHLGNTRVVTNSTGSPCYEADFYPYGGELTPSGFTNTCSTNYKFTGYERDPETAVGGINGLDYAIGRYYHSRIGRFMSPDPIDGDPTAPQSWNAYSYVVNNPLNSIDPLGLDPVVFQYWSTSNSITVFGGGFGPFGGLGGFSGVGVGDPNLMSMWTPSGFNPTPLGWNLQMTLGQAAAAAAPPMPQPVDAYGTWSTLGWRLLGGTSNFFAGAGDCLTGQCIPFVNHSLTEWARRLNGADSVVNKNSWSYTGREITGGVVGSALLSAGGATAAAIADGKNGAYFGRAINNPLFNGDALGASRFRFGWNWKGKAIGGQNVIRLGIGAARGTKWWNHIIFWSRGI